MSPAEAAALVAAVDAAPPIARPWVREGLYVSRTGLRSHLPALTVGVGSYKWGERARIWWCVYHPTGPDRRYGTDVAVSGNFQCADSDPTDAEFAEAMAAADRACTAGSWWVLA